LVSGKRQLGVTHRAMCLAILRGRNLASGSDIAKVAAHVLQNGRTADEIERALRSGIYTALRNLLADGHTRETGAAPKPGAKGGPAATFYSLTAKGVREANDVCDHMRAFASLPPPNGEG